MPMHAFRVTVPVRDEDQAVALLWEAGTTGIEALAHSEGTVALVAFFREPLDLEPLMRRLEGARIEPAAVPEVDWVARFREGFRAFRVGRFTVAPPWNAPRPFRHLLLVDPGRAFGTGTHETTRLCLGALEELADAGPLGRVLDLGAGTGLLALAAARLGASSVVAADLDPEATHAARTHARVNAVRLHVVRADGGRAFRPGAFDLVVANLTTPLLVERAREITGLRAARGALVLSGLLASDLPEVRDAYRHCGRAKERHDGEWLALQYPGGPS
jgi:ribosomal protein L11 methyltransferase